MTNLLPHPRSFMRTVGGLMVLAAMPACTGAVAMAQPASVESDNPLVQQARAGQFKQVLEQLKAGPGDERSNRVQALIDDLKQYQDHKHKRLERQHKAYEKAVARVGENLSKDRLADALIAAIQAREVAPDSAELMARADVKEAVKRAETAAKKAVAEEQWVDALAHYRLLDSLFEKQGRYREQLARIRRHARVLQMYAPKVLQDLQQAYADRQQARDADESTEQAQGDGDAAGPADKPGGDETDASDKDQASDDSDAMESDEAPIANIDFTSWKKQLRGVSPTMLRKTLRYAHEQHISGQGYTSLMQGVVHGLEVLLETEALAETFPGYKDKAALKQFRDHLHQLNDRLDQPGFTLNYQEAASIIDGLLAMNRQTLDLPTRVLVYEMTEGMTSRLDDFSSVIWPQDLAQFSRSTKGNFTGVGIQITRRDGQLVVVTPLPETPAYQAGIRAGDVIATVEGEDAAQWSLNRAVNEITGPEGSEVNLGIDRKGEKNLIKFDIERAEIEIESVRGWRHKPNGQWDYWIDEPAGIGYVRLSQFIPQTAEDMDRAISQLQQQGEINGLILDLRYNPGGLLSSAVNVADRFLDEGAIVSTVDSERNRNTKETASRRDTYPHFPVVILANDASASASEIVAGALQAHDRALVLGDRTFGKGSVQDLFRLVRRQAFLKLTTQYYMLPDGRIIHRKPGDKTWGVEPDLALEMTTEQRTNAMEMRQKADVMRQQGAATRPADRRTKADDLLKEGGDPQVQSALLYLKTRLLADDIAMAQGPDHDRTAR